MGDRVSFPHFIALHVTIRLFWGEGLGHLPVGGERQFLNLFCLFVVCFIWLQFYKCTVTLSVTLA